MKKRNPPILHLDEKIYLLCYIRPRHKEEIAKILYGEEETQSYGTITQKKGIITDMVKKGELITWKIKILKPDKKDKKKYWLSSKESNVDYEIDIPDLRSIKRTYCLSTIKPIKETIVEELKDNNKKIDQNRINQIENILKSYEFRNAVEWEIEKRKIGYKSNISPISFLFNFFTESAGNIFGQLLINPKITKKNLLSKWHLITEKNIRKHLKTQQNLRLVLDSLKISPSEVAKLKPLAKLYANMNTELLRDIMHINPIVKRNIMYMAIGSSNPKL